MNTKWCAVRIQAVGVERPDIRYDMCRAIWSTESSNDFNGSESAGVDGNGLTFMQVDGRVGGCEFGLCWRLL